MQEADLSAAILTDATLYKANLSFANLTNTGLIRANLGGATLTGAILDRADLRGAILTDATLDRANLRGAKYNTQKMQEKDEQDKSTIEPTQWPQDDFDPKAVGAICVDCEKP